MIRQYYTLEKITAELQCLWGYKLIECFSQEKDSAILVFSSGDDKTFLLYSSDNKFNSIFLRQNFIKAKKNTAKLFSNIIGETVQEINLIANERIIHLKLIYFDIYFTLFGGVNNNLYVVNRENIIVESLSNSKNLSGTNFKIQSRQILSLAEFPPNFTVLKAIVNSNCFAGKYYAEEICCRMQISPDLLMSQISKETLINIENQVLKLRRECNNSEYSYILTNKNGEKLLSLIPLSKYPEILHQFKSVSQAVEWRLIDLIKSDRFEKLKKEVLQKLSSMKNKTQKAINDFEINKKNLDNAHKYRLWAELLISQPEIKFKPGSEILLKNWEGKEILMPLNNKMTIAENAEYYFEKAKQTEKNIEIRKKQIPALIEKLRDIEALEKQIGNISRIDELEFIKKELIKLQSGKSIKEITKRIHNASSGNLKALNDLQELNVRETSDASTKFRKFNLGEGYILFVGKSASSNEELTMKFAKPYDLWFHARGAGGSHCILPLSKGKTPSRIIIQRAASIAAYYSQARGSKYTPVLYTFRKYVRKLKGSPTGTVTLSREEVIMVEPTLYIEEAE